MRPNRGTLLSTILVASLCAALMAVFASPAAASGTQLAMFEEDIQLFQHPGPTLGRLRVLGVQIIRLELGWAYVAPRAGSHRYPKHFDPFNPADYPITGWAHIDHVIQDARIDGIKVELDLSGPAPLWATSGAPNDGRAHPAWNPSPGAFYQFVRAVGKRYSGSYVPRGASAPLPRVNYWSVWNEPDYGPSLAPQGVPGNVSVERSPWIYRKLLDAAWNAFHQSGHGQDAILFGEVAPRGKYYWGVGDGMTPLRFLRALYCVDSNYHQLRGGAASDRGCPTKVGGSRRFRSQHPALFQASGFAVHPYMRWYPPNHEVNPDPFKGAGPVSDYASLGVIGNLTGALDRLVRVYGGRARFPIYDTEDGYITTPPKHDTAATPYVSQTTAAVYVNWMEYIEWRNPRLASTNQYLLEDPLRPTFGNNFGGFASGLLSWRGVPKAPYYAYRLPLFMPSTSTQRGHRLEVWGCVRAARYAILDSGAAQTAELQFEPASKRSYQTIKSIKITSAGNCYFDLRVPFTKSGTLRLVYTYPATDPHLPSGFTIYSRHIQVSVH